MMDDPPVDLSVAQGEAQIAVEAEALAEPEVVIETRSDGTVVIDLMALAPPPLDCLEEEPDPFNPEIIVRAQAEMSARLGAGHGPSDEEQFGSAIPRARLKLSDSAEGEANVINGAGTPMAAKCASKLRFSAVLVAAERCGSPGLSPSVQSL